MGDGRAGRRIVAFMQQHQLAAAMEHRAGLRRLDLERHHGRPVVVAAAHHDQAVGLAQAELGPFRRRRVGAVEHERRFHLAAREPFRILVRANSGPSIWTWLPMRPSAPASSTAKRADGTSGPARQDGEGARLAAALGRPHGVAHGDVAHQRRQHLGMKRRSACRSCCVPAARPRCRAAPRRCACAGCATAATSRRRCCRAGSRPSGSAPRRCPRPRGGTRRGSRWPRHRRRRPARPGGTTARRRAAPAATARARSPPCCRYRGRRTTARAAAPCRSRSRAESSLGATMLTPRSSLAAHALERPSRSSGRRASTPSRAICRRTGRSAP